MIGYLSTLGRRETPFAEAIVASERSSRVFVTARPGLTDRDELKEQRLKEVVVMDKLSFTLGHVHRSQIAKTLIAACKKSQNGTTRMFSIENEEIAKAQSRKFN